MTRGLRRVAERVGGVGRGQAGVLGFAGSPHRLFQRSHGDATRIAPKRRLEPLTLGREAAQLVAEVPASMMIILRGIPRGKMPLGLLARAGDSLHEIAFWLVRPQMAWSGNACGIHGMQEVWGSNPHSPTQVTDLIRTLNR